MSRGNSLVGLLVVVLIIAVLSVVFMKGGSVFGGPGSSRKDGLGTTVPGSAIAAARDEVCRSNLNQVRQSLGIVHDQDTEAKWPATLEETKLGADFYRCPLGHEPYRYNPETGEVKCPHPGHEGF